MDEKLCRLCNTGTNKTCTHSPIFPSGELSSMRHLKEEVESIARGKECGLCFADHDLRFQSGDTLICYRIKQIPQTVDWDPGF